MPASARPPGWCKAVLFDLDGTLADTAPDLLAALNVLRTARDLPDLPLEALAAADVAQGSRAMMRAHLLEPGEEVEPLRQRFFAAYDATGHTKTRLFDGIAEVLHHLEEEGTPWAIVTNKPTAQTLPLLPVLNLAGRPVAVVCGDTCAQPKPDPSGLLLVCAPLGLDPGDCLFVGDALFDRDAAAGCGMPFVGAGWGYWSTTAAVVLDDPRDLLGLL